MKASDELRPEGAWGHITLNAKLFVLNGFGVMEIRPPEAAVTVGNTYPGQSSRL